MKNLLVAIFTIVAGVCSAGTLRISELADAAGDNVERMTLRGQDDREEAFFVKKEAVLGDADIKEAWPLRDRIAVKLTDEGAGKLSEATANMRLGRDRLAIIVEGRLISAPVVQARLGAHFEIAGLNELDPHDLDDLARRMSGRPPRAEGEEAPPPQPEPEVETVPFTEEEYQRIKAVRERMGIFHIEAVPAEEELNRILRKGADHAEVAGIFGRPSSKSENPGYWIYRLAPEKQGENPDRNIVPDGFKVDFDDRKVVRWSYIFSDAMREEKIVGKEQEPPLLKAILPEIDLSAEQVDIIGFVEAISIPDPGQEVNEQDLRGLLTIVSVLRDDIAGDGDGDASLDADCDFMTTLAHHFAEAAALRKNAAAGRVRADALVEALSPYTFDGKPLPERGKPTGKAEPEAAPPPEPK